ncbi:MAG: lysophospholipid acyltransferase family protein [Bacteroidales bacterium]
MNRIIPGLIWLILWILSWLPGFILRFLSYLINAVVFAFFRYRSEVVKTNLSRSLPELPLLEQHKIEHSFYQHFSELFLETVMMIRLKPDKQSRRIRFSNPEIISQAYEHKQNIIIIAGHYGNWEWNVLPILASGYRILGVYKPQSSKLADQLMKNIRQKPGIILVPMKDILRVISRELKENNSPFVLLLVADQIPARGDIRFYTMFLNQETAFFTGGEKLAKRFSLPVYYVDQVKRRFAGYEARITPVYDGVSVTEEGAITTAFAQLLETSIRQKPYLWLWSHRRWKYRREELPLRV